MVWTAAVENPWYRLEWTASAPVDSFMPIVTPEDDGLRWGAAETFDGRIEWRLSQKRNPWNVLSPYDPIDEGQFDHSALELGGHFAHRLHP